MKRLLISMLFYLGLALVLELLIPSEFNTAWITIIGIPMFYIFSSINSYELQQNSRYRLIHHNQLIFQTNVLLMTVGGVILDLIMNGFITSVSIKQCYVATFGFYATYLLIWENAQKPTETDNN